MDKINGWAPQSVTFPKEWLNYYPVMPLGVSELINIVRSMVIRKKQVVCFMFRQSLFL